MLFEGPEKKLEVFFHTGLDLRKKDREFWQAVVEAAKAKILSVISDEKCDAYLLSESSLFVYSDRVILITCGTTTLVQAASFLIDSIGRESVGSVFYQRKNENFPHFQKTNFHEDIRILSKYVDGEAFQFGEVDDHYMYLFHSKKSSHPVAEDDLTLEILMHGLHDEAKEKYFAQPMKPETIQESRMREILPGFQIDDYVFDPCGYSLNALRSGKYFTIHVTPQDRGSYVSFETNALGPSQVKPCIDSVLKVFQPKAFDVVVFSTQTHANLKLSLEPYVLRRLVTQSLAGGYETQFYHFYEPLVGAVPAYNISGEVR